jgi:redox-sensitive bicupin YhaK (pirin superfamily)
MIKLQRSMDRRHIRTGSQETWMSFDQGNDAAPFHRGFRALDLLNEVKMFPGTEQKMEPDLDLESVTYVREGSLVVRHRPRKDEVLGPGFCQRANSHRLMIAGDSVESALQGAHIFVSSMKSHQVGEDSSYERKHYPYSDRRGHLRLIASPDGSGSSLRLRDDVRIYSSVLDPGHHVVHELSPGRGGWLHVVAGKILLVDQTLMAGDGASLDNELAVSFTAQEASEILLFDLA